MAASTCRRSEGRPLSLRRTACFASGAVVGAYLGIAAAMASGLTRVRRIRPDDTPEAVGLEFDEVTFPSRDPDTLLHGWLMPPPASALATNGHAGEGAARNGVFADARWIVMVHGFGTNRTDPQVGALGLARDLHDRGFGVLMFDMRCSGISDGRQGSAGFYERLDLLAALDYLVSLGIDRLRIGVLGFSLGGAVALMTCANPGTAAAVVSDSAFADLNLIIRQSMRGVRRPLAVFNFGMRLMARLLFGIAIEDVSPARSLAGSDTPVLIIHGELDDTVPRQHARLLARAVGFEMPEAAGGGNGVWIAPSAGHVQAYRTHPREYVSRVARFFDETLAA